MWENAKTEEALECLWIRDGFCFSLSQEFSLRLHSLSLEKNAEYSIQINNTQSVGNGYIFWGFSTKYVA